ncbi:MAG: putative protein [Holosporales bacterium]
MIYRQQYIQQVKDLFEIFPIVAVLGARQVGKSTLAKQFLMGETEPFQFYDLENDRDRSTLDQAQFALEGHRGLTVIDEIQRAQHLFPLLRYLVDTFDQRYLILGSSSRDLLNESTETLAGRIAYIELPPFSIKESGLTIDTHLVRGGFPKSLLGKNNSASLRWRQEYIKTFLERDLRQSGFDIEPSQMRRFWQMLAHYHGQIFNASEIATSLGISLKTAQRYLSILEGVFIVQELKPWYENIKKRQVKRSKSYFMDTGILNALLGITTIDELLGHPKLGAIWEGFALQEVIKENNFDRDDCYFWSTSNQAEIDLFVIHQGKRHGFEFKFSDTPKITKSMEIALNDLKLDDLTIVTPKGNNHKLRDNITVKPICCT